MYEELEGRLKWQKTDLGIEVAIPARRGALTILYGPLVALWLIAAAVRYWNLLTSTHTDDLEFTLQMIAIGIYILGFFFAVCWLIWTFTNETILSLDRSAMKIHRRVIGIDLSIRTFATADVHNLKFIHPSRSWASQGHTDQKTSRIQFQTDNKRTHTFAWGITEDEAYALFSRMHSIYKFANYLELTHTRVVL